MTEGKRGDARPRAGRPKVASRKVQVSLSLRPELVVQLDKVAEALGCSRSEALAVALEQVSFEDLVRRSRPFEN